MTRRESEVFVKAKTRAEEIAECWAESLARSAAADGVKRGPGNEVGILVGLEDLSLDQYREREHLDQRQGDARDRGDREIPD